ncbi:tail fiber domain-containing protein [Parafilimonas terrae]|uniref:Chaperone of endosialidase n=1 Tax=Parafilimonas terrae TaxID=1465490 RepID=A0A1I5S9L0_9BACT|nr:tail fiber domain-containing protein [Parafilimonas terrae]SFP67410.1 Chaperone of endosialidase [Parafilimonas terrae]
MKKIFLFMMLAYCVQHTSAQSWNTTGNSGLTTNNFLGTKDNKDLIFKVKNTERGRLLKTGIWRLGNGTNYVRIDTAGVLTFSSNAFYQVGSNKYVFRCALNPRYGLFFNSSAPQYEFRDSNAKPVFYVNANTGNAIFKGTLKIGTYTLPSTDGTNGQVLTTNGAGAVKWLSVNSNAANKNLSNLAAITKVNVSLLPKTDNSADLGSSTAGWKNIYISGKVYAGGVALISADNNNGSVSLGQDALSSNTGGSNTAIGYQALYANTTGGSNTATGLQALYSNSTGVYNAAFGGQCMFDNTTGSQNLAIGIQALALNTTGSNNAATGIVTLYSNTTGSQNTANGAFALYTNKSGNNNTALGIGADVTDTSLQNTTAIGAFALADASNKVRIGNTSVSSIGGQVGWTTFSDGRYKKNIKEDVKGLAFINALRPVTYTLDMRSINNYYNKNRQKINDTARIHLKQITADDETAGSKIIHTGLIAQEVETAAKKLNYDFDGVDKPQTDNGVYGLRYSEFVVPLIKAVQELSKSNNDKDAEIDSLKAQMNELKNLVSQIQQQCSQSSAGIENSIKNDYVTLSNAASLYQNVPNPFTNSTSINYYLPQQFSSAKIIVTDRSGRALKELNLTTNGKGVVHIDAGTLASGAYNYTLYVDGKFIASKRMLLAK